MTAILKMVREPEMAPKRDRRIKFTGMHRPLLKAFAKAKCGLTNRELALHVGIDPASAAARRRELMLLGFVRKTDKTRCAKEGHPATVYEITQEGRNQ